MARTLEAEPLRILAADGVVLGGHHWPAGAARPARSVVVIGPATSVRSRYYGRFAAFLAAAGFDVLTFDYRGIGESRPRRLRGFRADWRDWGELDLEAALRTAMARFPGRPVDVVAHSIGGFALGLAPSAQRLRRIVTVGAQYAHWRDYEARARLRMLLRWHVAMPALAGLLGYVPARRLGWMEDTPAGVARDWSRMGARFERTLRGGAGLPDRFARVGAPILAISLTDDPFGTIPAIERLLGYYRASPRTHLRIAPGMIGAAAIGHFAFFHDRFRDSLWPLARHWLEAGRLPAGAPGKVVAGRDATPPVPPTEQDPAPGRQSRSRPGGDA